MPQRKTLGIIVAALVALASIYASFNMQSQPFNHFSHVSDIFEHDKQPTGPNEGPNKDFRANTLPKLGILDRTYSSESSRDASTTQWQRLIAYLQRLNSANPDEQYKVLFVARHGEGVHNVKEKQVGREAWNSHWSKIDGDGTLTWVDPRLTDKGIQQAENVGTFWKRAMEVDELPAPEKIFSSPLTRCLQTTKATWSKVFGDPISCPVIVSETLRELFGVHVCDKRSSRSVIEAEFPGYEIEPGLTEQDELWTIDRRETLEEHSRLWTEFLQRLFEDNGDVTFVALTTHSGATRALYLAIGHPDVWTAAGSVVPIVVRGRKS